MAFPALYPTGQADLNALQLRNVGIKDYARHMLCQHDRRFGRHCHQWFLIFNILIRQRAKSTAYFYVSKVSRLQDLTHEELAKALDTDLTLLLQIVCQGSYLPGTCPYQRSRGNRLQAQARCLLPVVSPVFVTFSCADIQQYDLQCHLPCFQDYLTASDLAQQQIVQDNIQDNLHIVTHYLDLRFQAFLKHVVQPYLQYTDHQIHYKWQYRGSSHLYYLFQITSTPLID